LNAAARFLRVPPASALLGAAALASLVASLEPSFGASRGPTHRVLLHDASASCGARTTPDDEELAALVDGLGSNDLVSVKAFGRNVADEVDGGSCPPSELRRRLRSAPVDPGASSLSLALGAFLPAHGESSRNAQRRVELLLATDGLATDDAASLARIASALRGSQVVSLRVLPRGPVPLPSVVAELRGPGAARAGEPFSLEARGVATSDADVVELSDGARVVESRRVGAKGPFRLAFTRIEETAGPAAFTARIAGGAAIPPPVARVAVTAAGRALVVGTAPRQIPGLVAEWRAADDLRDEDAGAVFAAHDLVVLDDVPSAALDPFAHALADYVRRGGGVLLTGGGHSFGAGGWSGRAIEDLSPLVARAPDARGTFLYLAIDGSGSMAEPWSDAPGAATRDDVVRGAAASLARLGGADTTVALRRFAGDLTPPGSPPTVGRIGAVSSSVDALPAPGGPTALLPPLREALSMCASRAERRKAALVLTDGRTPERAADLHAALAALDAAGVRVTFVLPGDDALGDEAHTLRDALAGTKARVVGATSPERLAAAFLDVEEQARVDDPVVADRRLAIDPSASGLAAEAPASAARIDRVWLAEGARPIVVTDRGEPVAALRRVGLGAAAALATRPGDDGWLAAGEPAAHLVAALARAVARPASGRVRVERDGAARLLVRYEAPPGGGAAAFAEFDDGGRRIRVPLIPAGGGLLAADLGRTQPQWIDLCAADGRDLATAGVDAPAPPEYLDPPRADLDALAALVASRGEEPALPLAPWCAAAAAALALASVAAARIKSAPRLAR
jgi:hypothetical protein